MHSRSTSGCGETLSFAALPSTAAWQHQEARSGFEVVYFETSDDGLRFDGTTAAVEGGQTWVVDYTIRLDANWCTREAHVVGRSRAGSHSVTLAAHGAGLCTGNG